MRDLLKEILEAPIKLCNLCGELPAEWCQELEEGTKSDETPLFMCGNCRVLWESVQVTEILERMHRYFFNTKKVQDIVRRYGTVPEHIMSETIHNCCERALVAFRDGAIGGTRPV